MFVKLALTTLLFVGLANCQTATPAELQHTIVQPNNMQLPNNQNVLPNPQFGNMLPNNQNQMQMNGQMQPMNLLQSLRDIPARGLQMLNSVISNVRNMLPGMGRNGSQLFQQNGRLPMNQMNGQANLQGQNGLQLPTLPEPLGSLTTPMINSLSQGQLPNPSALTQSLTNGLGRLTQGLNGNGAANGGLSSPMGTQAFSNYLPSN